jgi:hypothetical protein
MTTRLDRRRSFLFYGRTASALFGASALVAILATACGYKRLPPDEAPPEWTACETYMDCALVELDCCDHCNGGTLFAVHIDHASEALEAMKEAGCSGACTEIACSNGTPTCEGGTCGFTLDGP